MKKLLVIGDSPAVFSGFSTVINNIFKGFPKEEFEIHQLGINYFGDPHNVSWKQYPASTRGDIWGFSRVKELCSKINPDLIFILNDVWVISRYLEILKAEVKPLPKIVVYYPVDSMNLDQEWFVNFDVVTEAIVYTKFGRDESVRVYPDKEFIIIPHGVDNDIFFKMDMNKSEIKKLLYPDKPEFYDNSFIILNSNRNQPRKRIDTTIEAFALFSKNKPENVKLYLHMGTKDAGWNLFKLASRYGIDSRLIVTNNNPSIQQISTGKLNLIYNATDVGINTSYGEGWSLTNTEHSAIGVPQVVPNHSACAENWGDCGILIPAYVRYTNSDTLTTSLEVKPDDAAMKLEELYNSKELYDSLAKKSLEKFTSEKYNWSHISKQFQEVIEKCLQ